jgi:putative ABC transport system substrate-binding protein
LALLGVTVAAGPLHAQKRPARVGVLLAGVAPPLDGFELVREMERLGYTAGQNITYDLKAADGDRGRLPRLAQGLIANKPDVIVGSTAPVAAALSAATRDIPIVMLVVSESIALGVSRSISRPTGNMTGFTIASASLGAKRLELLRELVPAAQGRIPLGAG